MQISRVFINCLEQEKPGMALEDGCVGNVVHFAVAVAHGSEGIIIINTSSGVNEVPGTN